MTNRVVHATAHVDCGCHVVRSVVDRPVAARAETHVVVAASKEYEGEYESTPQFDNQLYRTNGLLMKDDFLVLEIPVHSAPNEYGDTLTIGE